MSFRTTPPLYYIPPTLDEMRTAAEKIGLKAFSPDLLCDMANIAAGGKVNPVSSYLEEIRRQEDKKIPAPDSDGEWKIPSTGEYTKNRETVLNDYVQRAVQYHQRVADFLQTLDLQRLPGDTPLEKAVNCLSMLSKMKGGSGSGDPLPIFQEKNGESVAEEINETLEIIDNLQSEEKELLNPDGELSRREIAEDFLRGKKEIIQLARQLDEIVKFRATRLRKYSPDPFGDYTRSRGIKSLNELPKLYQSEWTYPRSYATYRQITGIAQVRERVTCQEQKQLIYLILDCSGSMDEGKRIQKALAILFNRLKAVVAGDAEVLFSFFDTRLYEMREAKTKEQAIQLMKTVEKANFSGGNTNISGCVTAARDRINEFMEKGGYHKPEIVVVTDGDDKITLKAADFPGTKVHGFLVERTNRALVEFCRETGGIAIDNL